MTTYTETIRARVSAETKATFLALCEKQGKRESDQLREIIELVMQRNPSVEPILAKRGRRPYRVGVGFLAGEYQQLLTLAGGAKRCPSYVLKVMRAHFFKSAEFTAQEIESLDEANRQLLYVGRSLNQIAHQLNTSLNAADLVHASMVEDLSEEIRQHRIRIDRLIDACLSRALP